MWLRILALSSLLLCASPVTAQGPAPLRPLVVDGERYFTVQWQAGDTHGRSNVHGVIVNEFGFAARRIRLLVDSLDAGGGVTAQTIAYVPFDLPPGTRSYFEARVPAPASSYRVSVYQWEWIQSGGGDSVR